MASGPERTGGPSPWDAATCPDQTAVQRRDLAKTNGRWLTYNHMVVHRQESEETLNQIFRALADGTRRDILARSLTESLSVSELAARYEMSFAAVQKHVAVLERAGLIQKRANGREQLVSTNHARLQRASELLDYFESIWRQRMAQLDDVLLPKGR
ncbi:ArsR/SmtB family transcription factor [Hyalangium gracile]|uniref:ArsR/SmtB family transcription factor n=1 Tax=Hyalangium gracile TaxID=394092 RepID=UPI00295E6A99|nr:metalloregulator ArsR/SmtB family transcription factor [Hyalangium gracile]